MYSRSLTLIAKFERFIEVFLRKHVLKLGRHEDCLILSLFFCCFGYDCFNHVERVFLLLVF